MLDGETASFRAAGCGLRHIRWVCLLCNMTMVFIPLNRQWSYFAACQHAAQIKVEEGARSEADISCARGAAGSASASAAVVGRRFTPPKRAQRAWRTIRAVQSLKEAVPLMIFSRKKSRPVQDETSASDTFDRYVSSAPCLQNAIDAVSGWNTAFPPRFELKAGALATDQDPRIQWAMDCFGSLEGRHVLELGPVEGGHTTMLEAAGARIDAIEANQLAFLRCLITKEVVGLTQSKFWLGDLMKGLENWDQSYDLIVACGVLHHLKEPLRLLELAARRSDAFYLWTNVVTEEAMPASDPRRVVFAPTVEIHHFHGIDVRAYRRTYAHAEDHVAFCRGMNDERRWLHRDDLIEALKRIGFHNIQTNHHEPNRPALSIFAQK
jgi:hypothetical protein